MSMQEPTTLYGITAHPFVGVRLEPYMPLTQFAMDVCNGVCNPASSYPGQSLDPEDWLVVAGEHNIQDDQEVASAEVTIKAVYLPPGRQGQYLG